MTGYLNTSNSLTLLLIVIGDTFLHTSNPNLVKASEVVGYSYKNYSRGYRSSEDKEARNQESKPILKDQAEEDDIFRNVDPKTLAGVLLEALNNSQVKRRAAEHDRMEEDRKNKQKRLKKEESYTHVGITERADQGNSHTSKLQAGDENYATLQKSRAVLERGSDETEKQFRSGVLKSLATMMKEFPSLNTAPETKEVFLQNQRESRAYGKNEDIMPASGGRTLAMSKKKLKWQEETQKALNIPIFKENNFVDETVNGNYKIYPVQSQPPVWTTDKESTETKGEVKGVLRPEAQEAQAKAEQEEIGKQATEAQEAKIEKEKLADVASEMQLHLIVKQNNGNKEYSTSLSKATEDKTSNGVQEVTEDDDIDPKTIDQLIESSSKLHIPAEDVVDVISDVENRKSKKEPSETTLPRNKPAAMHSLFPPTNSFLRSENLSDESKNLVSRQPSTAVNHLKTWLQKKALQKTQDQLAKSARNLVVPTSLRPKPQMPMSFYHNLRSPQSILNSYRSHPYTYRSYYQPYLDRYPIYFSPSSRPKFNYYIHKPGLNPNSILKNSVSDLYTSRPKHLYNSWARPWPRKALQHRPYFTSHPLSLYPWILKPQQLH